MELSTKILHVDLSKEKTWIEEVSKELYRKFLGARGISAYLLFNNVKPGIDALSPENLLIFGAGTLTGTMAPCSGRVTITTKSPATGRYAKSSAGGAWGAELKQAGYQFVVIHGKAKKPVYIKIDGMDVDIKEKNNLWGKDIWETNDILHRKLGEDYEIAGIGPAGENLVEFAGIIFSYYNAAGRCGIGAVMGSKNLKAIAVKGKIGLKLAEPEKFFNLSRKLSKELLANPSTKLSYLYGTAGGIEGINSLKALPSYNFKRGYSENADKISGKYMVESGLLKGRRGCHSCVVNCHRYTRIEKGKYKGCVSGGPEYETLSALGAGCGIYNMEAIIAADNLCWRYGLDTISTGSVIQWAMESNERGVLDNNLTKGFNLKFGNEEVVFRLIKDIAFRREGLGELLAQGVKKASEIIGKDSEKWAVQAKGLEQSRVDTRSANSYALAFAVNPRGPDHLHAQPIAEFGTKYGSEDLIKKITGSKKFANPYIIDKRAEIVRWHEDICAADDSLGFCFFTSLSWFIINEKNMAQLLTYYLGEKFTPKMVLEAGRRTIVLERCFNVREGYNRKHDVLPWRLMNEESTDHKGINSKDKLDKMLNEYYRLHGWNIKTGIPTAGVLEELGLEWVIQEKDIQ
jgi:aldehyde:ferredoxin oxidoreductase